MFLMFLRFLHVITRPIGLNMAIAIGIAMVFGAAGGAVLAKDWPTPRANMASTGSVETTLPVELGVVWEFKADEAVEATPVIVGDSVYLVDAAGSIYAINERDGKQRWRFDTELGFTSGPSVDDGLLVIGDLDGKVYAIETSTGKQRWTAETNAEVSGSAAFDANRILITSQDGNLYALDRDDGHVIWTYETDDQIRCSPTIAVDRTFLGGCDGQLHSVLLADGTRAATPLPLGGPTGSTPAVMGENAYLPTMQGVVIAFDWKQNKELWRYEDDERSQEYRTSPAVNDRLVIVTSQNKQVDALDVATGKRVWRHTLRRRADASPVIAGEDCWVASTDGRLSRLSMVDGSEKWQYEVSGKFSAAPGIANDRLYVADDNGVLRCFADVETQAP